MQPAFGLGEAAPAAGTLVFAQKHSSRAGPAADARIALIMERVIGGVVLGDETPALLLGPVGQRADFDEAEFLVPADDRRCGPVGTLIAANRTRPGVHSDDSLLQHPYFAVKAALVRIRAIDGPAVLPLVL